MIGQSRPLTASSIVGFLALGAVATGCATSDTRVVRWVDKTVAQRQPPAEDKRFDDIGWVTNIREAIKLGTETDRPVFLWTGKGRINTGRC